MSEIKIYRFGPTTDGDASMVKELGGKGANLAEMCKMGLPIPPGFTIPCQASMLYKGKNAEERDEFLLEISAKVTEGMEWLREQFGYYPLVSVRSGAPVSMPGMMDTILDVGINPSEIDKWKDRLGARTTLDCQRRFLQMYGSIAIGVSKDEFENVLRATRQDAGVEHDWQLSADHLSRLVHRYQNILQSHGVSIPDDPQLQRMGAVEAVFKSWDNDRCREYRKLKNLPEDMGTAVTIQSMVFGNIDELSCSGVAFSRNKNTGERKLFGDFAVNAQGEDVVGAICPTQPIKDLPEWNAEVAHSLSTTVTKLEKHYKTLQDVEFTVQAGKLWLLQCRTGMCLGIAAFRIAYDMVKEGLITKEEAIQRLDVGQLLNAISPQIDPTFKGKPITTGKSAGGNIVMGKAMFSSESAVNCKSPSILVRHETTPDDLDGMIASIGVLTGSGGTTSHAAVVASGLNKTCVVGCLDLHIVGTNAYLPDSTTPAFSEGDIIAIDGSDDKVGKVFKGEVPTIDGSTDPKVQEVGTWFAPGPFAHRITPASPHDLLVEVGNCKSDAIYLDFCCLGDPENIVSNMNTVKQALTASPAKVIVIDLAPIESYYEHMDRMFDKMFGGFTPAATLETTKVSMIALWPEALTKRCIVKLAAGSHHAAKLRSKGFRVMGPIATVADLMSANGPVEVADDVIEKVFGTKEAYEFVKKAVEKLPGHKPAATQVPEPAYWHEFIFKKGA